MFNIPSYATQTSTAAIIPPSMDTPSLAPSSSSTSTFVAGGRALDRHNPIITDEKRSGISSKPGTPVGTPLTNHVLQQKPKTPQTTPKTPTLFSPKSKKKKSNNNKLKKNPVAQPTSFVADHDDYVNRKSFSKPSDLMMKAAVCNISKPGVDSISPPESSRYLLDDSSFLDVFSDFDPVLKLAPYDDNNNNNKNNNVVDDELVDEEVSKSDASSKLPPTTKTTPLSESSTDQVVVLRVSLHCRGCERKMKKHLSRMSGVTSFDVDFTAKKVTVVGDVTPLQVLASISKVKTAKLWTPPTTISSSYSNIYSRNMEDI